MVTETAARPPQFRDRVEVIKSHIYGEVKQVDTTSCVYYFYVLLDDGWAGWYTADELRVVAVGPASDPANYQ